MPPPAFPYNQPVGINRIKVKVRILNTTTTVKDSDFREAKQNRTYSEPVEIIGQTVGLKQTFQLQRTQTGDSVPSAVHFVFRFRELNLISPGFVIKKGDRIVEIDGVPCDFNVIQSVKASPFGGNRQKTFALPILLHVQAEQQRKKLGSI
jgi:hypothetical protein